MFVAALRKVHRQVLIRVPIAARAPDPDFFAAQTITQGVEDAHLVGDPVDPVPASGPTLTSGRLRHDQRAPLGGHDAVERNDFIGSIEVGVALDVPGEQVHGEQETGPVGAEAQRPEQGRQQTPVMMGVGRPHHDLNLLLVAAPGQILLGDFLEFLLAHHREDDLADLALGFPQRRLRDPKENPVLPGDLLKLPQQHSLDPLLGPCPDPVDNVTDQVRQLVCNLLGAQKAERGEQGVPDRSGVPSDLVEFLSADAAFAGFHQRERH